MAWGRADGARGCRRAPWRRTPHGPTPPSLARTTGARASAVSGALVGGSAWAQTAWAALTLAGPRVLPVVRAAARGGRGAALERAESATRHVVPAVIGHGARGAGRSGPPSCAARADAPCGAASARAGRPGVRPSRPAAPGGGPLADPDGRRVTVVAPIDLQPGTIALPHAGRTSQARHRGRRQEAVACGHPRGIAELQRPTEGVLRARLGSHAGRHASGGGLVRHEGARLIETPPAHSALSRGRPPRR